MVLTAKLRPATLCSQRLAAATILVIFLSSSGSILGEASKRLILKDGSYQSVTQYTIQADRVRYRSIDREEWEELPKDLVDWKATEDFNSGRVKAEPSADARELDREAEADLKAEAARTPEVAPGLRLPEDGGVVMLDAFQNEPSLIEIPQNGGELNRDMGRNILRGAINPVAGQKQSVELEGIHAAIQAHEGRPVIFVGPQPDDSAAAAKGDSQTEAKTSAASSDPQRFRIVRALERKEARVVGVVKIGLTGKVSQEQKFVKTSNEQMSGGWIKITPIRDLPAGEYAVVEMLGKAGMNLYVWDFGVNPKAPANASAWKAVGAKPPVPNSANQNSSPKN
jgi:hypothetical protein